MAYPVGAVQISGTIGTTSVLDTYATHQDYLGFGGLRAVADSTERDAITTQRRTFGMVVTSQDGSGSFILANVAMGGTDNVLTNNANWIPYSTGGGGGIAFTSVTYAALNVLIATLSLVEGNYYLINDYQTIYDQPDYDAAGNPKPVVTTNTGTVEPLIVQASSVNQINERAISTLFPLDVIQYDVSFTNTEVMNASAKGRIILRTDDNNNTTNYDHRQVVFKRYEKTTSSGIYTVIYDNGNPYIDNIPTFGTGCYSNKIGNFYTTLDINNTAFILSNNIFDDDCWDNTTGADFYNNTIGSLVYENKFGDLCHDNVIEGDAYNNVINNNFSLNTIGSQFYNNSILNGFRINVISSGFQGNEILSGFRENTILAGFGKNRIGYDFRNPNIVIGTSFLDNQIGNNFGSNIAIGRNFQNNVIGDNFQTNSIADNFLNNQIKNYFLSNTTGNFFSSNNIDDNFQSNNISNNFGYDSTNSISLGNTIGDNCHFNFIGDNFYSNFIKNSCIGNTFTAVVTFNYTILSGAGYVAGEQIMDNATNTIFATIVSDTGTSMVVKGAQIIAHPANLVMPYCQSAMITRCLENRVFAVTANRIGRDIRGEDDFTFTGQSQITAFNGNILSSGHASKADSSTTDIDVHQADNKMINPFNDLINDRRENFYF